MRRAPVWLTLFATVTLVGLVGLTASRAEAVTRSCRLPVFGPGARYHPQLRGAGFTAKVTNRWFPLRRAHTLVYTGIKDRKQALDIVMTSVRTKMVDGVRTRVVEDRLYLDGVLAERTSDYYAQDRCGNVWYFGEDTAELDARGRVTSTEGSFHAGVAGAQPGVFMQARPQLGRRFRQEWLPGHAEDTYKVIRLSSRVSVAYGSYREALRSAETTALEPAVLDNKYYVEGVGEVAEIAVTGPREELRLVEILH
jgi:hypothetical protein